MVAVVYWLAVAPRLASGAPRLAPVSRWGWLAPRLAVAPPAVVAAPAGQVAARGCWSAPAAAALAADWWVGRAGPSAGPGGALPWAAGGPLPWRAVALHSARGYLSMGLGYLSMGLGYPSMGRWGCGWR